MIDTKEFFRSKSDRALREKHYNKKIEIKKEVDERAEIIAKQAETLKHTIGHEVSFYGYCLLIRQGDQLIMVDREEFTIGLKSNEQGSYGAKNYKK